MSRYNRLYIFLLKTIMKHLLAVLFIATSLSSCGQALEKIPLDPRRFYQENNPIDGNVSPMVDGNTGSAAFLGYSQILNPSKVWYEFPAEQNVTVTKLRYW